MKYLAAIALAALPLFAQEPPKFGEKVDVNLVLIDAIVTDSKGNQILGLDKNDFVIKENGVQQSIDNVDYFTNRKLLNAPEQNAPFKVEQVKEGRYFVLFFQKPDAPQIMPDLITAANATRDFIKNQMLPGDEIAVVGHDARLKIYSDFTSDKVQLLKALDQAVTWGAGIKTAPATAAGQPSILANMPGNIDKTGSVYEALGFLADSMHSIKGRKNVVMFSPGVLELDDEVRNGIVLSQSKDFDPMIRALNRSNVSVYPVNILRQQPVNAAPALHQSLERIAMETNGEYFRYPVSVAGPLKQIEKTNNGYYLISYYAKHPAGSGFQKVQVSTVNREFRVKAREGYVYGD